MKTINQYINEKQQFLVKGHTKKQTVTREITYNELNNIIKEYSTIVSYCEDAGYYEGYICRIIWLFKTSDSQHECGQEDGVLDGSIDSKMEKYIAEKFKKITGKTISEFENNKHICNIECFYKGDLLNICNNDTKIYDCRYEI